MENFSIHNDALTSYVQLFKGDIEKQVVDLYNEDFVVVTGEKSTSYVFLDTSVIMLILIDDSVVNLSSISYDFFISDKLIDDIENFSLLPSRIRRYKDLGIKRFRAEVIEQLQLGNIHTDKEGTFAIWEDYNLKFKFDSYLRLANIDI